MPVTMPITKPTATTTRPITAIRKRLMFCLCGPNQATASGWLPMTEEIRAKTPKKTKIAAPSAAPPKAGAMGSGAWT